MTLLAPLRALYHRLTRPLWRCLTPRLDTCLWCGRAVPRRGEAQHLACEVECIVGPYGAWWVMQGREPRKPQREEDTP